MQPSCIGTSCSPSPREPEEWVRLIAENNNNPDPLVFDDDDGLDNPDDVPNNPNASPSEGDVNFNNFYRTSPEQSGITASTTTATPTSTPYMPTGNMPAAPSPQMRIGRPLEEERVAGNIDTTARKKTKAKATKKKKGLSRAMI